MTRPNYRSRLRGGLLGLAVGDALGVPVEFQPRAALRRQPVTGMRAGGTHGTAAGVWSDDTSMTLCVLDGFVESTDSLRPIADRFLRWADEGLWTAEGDVFDIGVTTGQALGALDSVDDPRDAGLADERSNGNGSLMRTLSVALAFAGEPKTTIAERAHDVSRLTHAHPRSQMACGIYSVLAAHLLRGERLASAWDATRSWAMDYYDVTFPNELNHVQHMLERRAEDWRVLEEGEVGSSGYVLHTFEAAIWCLMTTVSYPECVLRAVNMGFDTDTTAAAAGGLAGALHGEANIPAEWLGQLKRRPEIEALADRALATFAPREL